MGEVINLRRARKQRDRVAAADAAAANRAKHGRTKGAKAADRDEAARLAATLDGAKREDP